MELLKLYRTFLKESLTEDSPGAAQKLKLYTELLFKERKVRNIIGPEDIKTIAKEHILPSARLAVTIDESAGVDIGTGAGLPGMVIAILFSRKKMTLIEPKKSRVDFLLKVKGELGLNNTEIVRVRAETAGRSDNYRERFTFATCRAVAGLKVSSELALPFLKIGGVYYAQKGKQLMEEISEAEKIIEIAGGRTENIREDKTVIIRKTGSTPLKYPRRWKRIIR
ncbi:MAG: 16S rRNA (guanine(527)-N(7))-methyltransferase RsmG [Elusimicrobia bacterium]|jgi:16S rRNA (guanine527-N7)-methyltransferase|nr:16S rRNA (guanine(527)-N(7))-methyltransferase RsmG [Elusimicrobiota bacterium]